ncbi:MAG: hypothetical protein WCO33_04035 [bacterium]
MPDQSEPKRLPWNTGKHTIGLIDANGFVDPVKMNGGEAWNPNNIAGRVTEEIYRKIHELITKGVSFENTTLSTAYFARKYKGVGLDLELASFSILGNEQGHPQQKDSLAIALHEGIPAQDITKYGLVTIVADGSGINGEYLSKYVADTILSEFYKRVKMIAPSSEQYTDTSLYRLFEGIEQSVFSALNKQLQAGDNRYLNALTTYTATLTFQQKGERKLIVFNRGDSPAIMFEGMSGNPRLRKRYYKIQAISEKFIQNLQKVTDSAPTNVGIVTGFISARKLGDKMFCSGMQSVPANSILIQGSDSLVDKFKEEELQSIVSGCNPESLLNKIKGR